MASIWLLSALLMLVGLAGAIRDLVGAYRASGPRSFDLFAPHVAFPVAYAGLYGVGSLWFAHVLGPSKVLPLYPFCFVGLLAYLGGVLAVSFLSRGQAMADSPQRGWIPRRLALATALLFAFSATLSAWIMLRTGIPILSSDVETSRTLILPQVGGYVYYLARTIAVPSLLAIVYFFLHRRRLSNPARLLWLAIAALGLLALAASGYRNGVVFVLFTAVVAYSYLVRRVRLWYAAVFVAVLLVLVAAYGLFRSQGAIAWDTAAIARRLLHEVAVVPVGLANILDKFPSEIDFFYGRGMLLGFLALAPGEQPVLGLLLKDLLGLDYAGGGFSPSILGSFYLEFGWPGVVGGMFLYGLLLAFLFQRLRRHPSEYPSLFYSFTLVYSLVAIRTGLLNDIFAVWFLVVLSAVHVYCRESPRLSLSTLLARLRGGTQ
jgi:oligosaccharide repeat unit polymerase